MCHFRGCGEHRMREQPEAGFTVAVVEDRVEASIVRSANPAHAEIRARSIADPQVKVSLTRGMANAILKSDNTEIRTVE
jgi:predicted metalloprotease